MKEGFFTERGISYRVSELSEERPTLVFIHGLSGNSSAWRPYEDKLAGRYNILNIDLRGHGRSKRWPRYDDYTLPLFGEDIALLLSHLSITRYSIVAHCFGGLVALELLRKRGDAEKFIMLAPEFGLRRLTRTRLTKTALALAVKFFSLFQHGVAPGQRVDYEKFGYTPDWDPRRITADILDTGIATYLFCLDHGYRYEDEQEWAKVSVPTFIVHGKRDTYIPVEHAVELSHLLPHAKLQILESANHILILNNVSEISSAIEKFLQDQS